MHIIGGLQKIIFSVMVVTLSIASSLFAEPITLKCVTSEGDAAADLVIDIEKKELIWGYYSKYDIIHYNENYISAYEKPGGTVGGEIMVIDRRSGDYKRAAVGMFLHKGESPDKARLTERTWSGRCVKQLF